MPMCAFVPKCIFERYGECLYICVRVHVLVCVRAHVCMCDYMMFFINCLNLKYLIYNGKPTMSHKLLQHLKMNTCRMFNKHAETRIQIYAHSPLILNKIKTFDKGLCRSVLLCFSWEKPNVVLYYKFIIKNFFLNIDTVTYH